MLYIYIQYNIICGSGSLVGIATELRAGGSGIESPWGRDFPPAQTGPGAHPASCKMGTGSFPGVKCGRGVLLTTHPLLVPLPWKSRAIPLYPNSGPHRACKGITLTFIYKIELSWVVTFYRAEQWLRCCATNRKVAGSIPAGVNGIFH